MKLRTLLVIMCLAISAIPIGIIGGFQGFRYTSIMLIGLIFLVTFFVMVWWVIFFFFFSLIIVGIFGFFYYCGDFYYFLIM